MQEPQQNQQAVQNQARAPQQQHQQQVVNLKSSEILDHPSMQICNAGRQAALAEILEILTVVCETHKLPLAQTWVPCRHRSVLAYGGGSKKSCTSFDGSCMGQVCMSTTDVASYVVDAHMWGFRDACVEHHLQKGQGVAGQPLHYASHVSHVTSPNSESQSIP
ncbi:protein NLP6 [Cinnamomum micranthum f. kanehirae]|uniref:Protein NLP6 n=1 Tax=Cinnamomum micranthum f. kanehirae TaxID=337451 RepID=A0A3S3NXM7_9MAGN|nr:protein NLP6 [Cinnamomum micranthum f. kanehirae]